MNRFSEFTNSINEFGLRFTIESYFFRITHNNYMLEKTIQSHLKKENFKLFQNVNEITNEDSVNAKKIVWTFWWQGIESIPDILRICYNSHLQHIAFCVEVMILGVYKPDY